MADFSSSAEAADFVGTLDTEIFCEEEPIKREEEKSWNEVRLWRILMLLERILADHVFGESEANVQDSLTRLVNLLCVCFSLMNLIQFMQCHLERTFSRRYWWRCRQSS